jgi:hypothetical protein
LQRRSRLATIAKAATAVAAIPLLLASLAFAGVTLPEGAQDAFDRVGIELPNQPSDQSAAAGKDSGQPASTKSEAADGVSGQGNSSEAHQHALKQRQKANGKAKGHKIGKAIGLNEAIPPGLSGDTGPPAHSQAGGSQRSASAPGQLKQPGPPHPPRGRARELCTFLHHQQSATARSIAAERQWLDRLWICDGLLRTEQDAGTRAKLRKMRRAELRGALRSLFLRGGDRGRRASELLTYVAGRLRRAPL